MPETEYRIVQRFEVDDVQMGVMPVVRQIMTAPDRDHAVMWSESFQAADLDVWVEAREVSDWAPLDDTGGSDG